MVIGIDISQLAYPETGVANYLEKLVEELVKLDTKNEYILFFLPCAASWTRQNLNFYRSQMFH